MPPLKAYVRNGRLVLDEPTDRPEGEEMGCNMFGALGAAKAVPVLERNDGVCRDLFTTDS